MNEKTVEALYYLRGKSDSLRKFDEAFVLEMIAVHESGQRQLSSDETRRIIALAHQMWEEFHR